MYVECLRFTFFIGLQARFLSTDNTMGIIQMIVMGGLAVIVIGYPVKVGIEIKAFINDR